MASHCEGEIGAAVKDLIRSTHRSVAVGHPPSVLGRIAQFDKRIILLKRFREWSKSRNLSNRILLWCLEWPPRSLSPFCPINRYLSGVGWNRLILDLSPQRFYGLCGLGTATLYSCPAFRPSHIHRVNNMVEIIQLKYIWIDCHLHLGVHLSNCMF